MTYRIVIFLFLLSFITENKCEENKCLNRHKCGECIQDPNCVWCQNPNDKKTNCRETQADELWCDLNNRVTVNSSYEITENKDLNSQPGPNQIQMKPQRVTLKIRKNTEYEIDFQFARAENPLDLYLLLDASNTMNTYKQIIADLGKSLVEAVSAHTSDFRIGFGSFVDKPIFPFDYAEGITPNCKGCERSYSFINQLKLTNDTTAFTNKVKNTNSAGNVDAPEGGLEALMQTIVCADEIGWRPEATHIILFCTDETSHIAGDGRLLGIVKPNDGSCHMSGSKYTKEKEIDYPSISHLSYKAKEHNVHIIFAIAKNDIGSMEVYQNISHNVELSKYALLTEDGEQIIKLIVDTYTEILHSVNIIHEHCPTGLSIQFMVKCPNSNSLEFSHGYTCSDLKVGQTVDFKAILKARHCLENDTVTLAIRPDGVKDKLTIDLEVICKCDCEKNIDYSQHENCSNQGHTVCGLCECNPGHTGRYCECSREDNMSTDHLSCVDKSTQNEICNGNGFCQCGVCQCDSKYYGLYCECEDLSCPKYRKELCGGPSYGTCKCGKCECKPGWEGPDCSCSTSTEQCIPNYGIGQVCSGKGKCECGKCKCEEGYHSDFCQECVDCSLCKDLDPCVKAYISKTPMEEVNGPSTNCSTVIIYSKEQSKQYSNPDDWNKCLLEGKLGCKTLYQYAFDKKSILIQVGETHCPFISSIPGIILTILLPIIIGGLISFFVWKAVVTYKDKAEYAQFIQDQQKWKAESNPLYKPAQTQYNNPMFNKNS